MNCGTNRTKVATTVCSRKVGYPSRLPPNALSGPPMRWVECTKVACPEIAATAAEKDKHTALTTTDEALVQRLGESLGSLQGRFNKAGRLASTCPLVSRCPEAKSLGHSKSAKRPAQLFDSAWTSFHDSGRSRSNPRQSSTVRCI
jgi:hypothetical protein